MGNKRLYEIMKEKEAIYSKEDFTDEDGIRASELEGEFAALDGWNAESEATTLLNGLGILTELHERKMSELRVMKRLRFYLPKHYLGTQTSYF